MVSLVGVNQRDLLHVPNWPLVTAARMDGTITTASLVVMGMDEHWRWDLLQRCFSHFPQKRNIWLRCSQRDSSVNVLCVVAPGTTRLKGNPIS